MLTTPSKEIDDKACAKRADYGSAEHEWSIMLVPPLDAASITSIYFPRSKLKQAVGEKKGEQDG